MTSIADHEGSRAPRLALPLLTLALALLVAASGCGPGGSDGDADADGDADVDGDGDGDSTGRCGDGVVDPGEDCDANNDSAEDECLPDCRWACGDGVVNAIEACDTAIPAGEAGACPVECDDEDPCTSDTLAGVDCEVECAHGAISACADGDGCCPTGCAATDPDCDAECGNEEIEPGETCDPPATCPTSCEDDGDFCTDDALTGSAEACTAACPHASITACTDGDGCCLAACDRTNDDDCSAECGNGIIEAGEFCDPVASCPTACDDGDECTVDALVGAAARCDARCTATDITVCADADGCCPSTCGPTTDDDCSASCGNGVIDGGETCDPPASCPTSCPPDADPCTVDELVGLAANCNARCLRTTTTTCTDGDLCCPAGCYETTDADCAPSCGNGVIETGETCDPVASCPTSCDDGDECTVDALLGAAASCTARCTTTDITACAAGDGCCPAGCYAATDPDCTAECGNGVQEPGEECDDGDLDPGDGCDELCMLEPRAFLATDLDLMDPHIFVSFFGCRDITNSGILGSPSINQQFQDAVQEDGDADGLLDLSVLLVFRPQDQRVPHTGDVDVGMGSCTAPLDLADPAATECDVDPPNPLEPTTYSNQASGSCMAPYPGTTHGYTPSIADPVSPCFVSLGVPVTFELGGILFPLQDLQVAATWLGDPADSLANGLMRGFMSEAEAEATILPADLPLVGGQPLASLLPGGDGCCARHDDRDVGPDGVTVGWWFYFNAPFHVVTWLGP